MRKPRVLVCDDEAVARRGAVRALGGEAYDFLECAEGRECLEALGRPRHGVDLVLLDLRMPGMDGMTTLAHLTALPAPPPVVVVTADSTLRTAIDAVKAGAADYLSKPYEIDELRFVVAEDPGDGPPPAENRRLAEEVQAARRRAQAARRVAGHAHRARRRGARGPRLGQRADPRRVGHRQGAGGPPHPRAERSFARVPS